MNFFGIRFSDNMGGGRGTLRFCKKKEGAGGAPAEQCKTVFESVSCFLISTDRSSLKITSAQNVLTIILCCLHFKTFEGPLGLNGCKIGKQSVTFLSCVIRPASALSLLCKHLGTAERESSERETQLSVSEIQKLSYPQNGHVANQ